MAQKLIQDIGTLWEKYHSVYLNGVLNTLVLALVATAIGCLIGFICGVLYTIPYKKTDNIIKRVVLGFIRVVVRIYIEVFRGTPMILQSVFIYYGAPYFFNYSFKSIWGVSILIVSINTGAYMAESVRGGIISIDPGQTEGAKAIGMNHFQTMLYVILPQAIRNILPQIGNNFIINVKDTSIMFIIGFMDFFAVHKMAAGATFKYFPSAAIEMIGYLILTLVASFILRRVEKRMAGSDNYELVNSDQLVMAAGTYSYPKKPSKEREYEDIRANSAQERANKSEEGGC